MILFLKMLNSFVRNKDKALNMAACINNYTPASVNELIRNNQRFKDRKVSYDCKIIGAFL